MGDIGMKQRKFKFIPGLITKKERKIKNPTWDHLLKRVYWSQMQWAASLCTVCTHATNMCLSESQGLIMGSTQCTKKRKHRQSVLTDRQTDGHTCTHTSYTAASTAVYTPSVLSPGWFWHRHRSQTTSHISNANCPSGQKWSTSVKYRNEFQSEEQLGEKKYAGMSHLAQSAS